MTIFKFIHGFTFLILISPFLIASCHVLTQNSISVSSAQLIHLLPPFVSTISFMYVKNKIGPSTVPFGTPHFIFVQSLTHSIMCTWSLLPWRCVYINLEHLLSFQLFLSAATTFTVYTAVKISYHIMFFISF